jgi:hypothetical protein
LSGNGPRGVAMPKALGTRGCANRHRLGC